MYYELACRNKALRNAQLVSRDESTTARTPRFEFAIIFRAAAWTWSSVISSNSLGLRASLRKGCSADISGIRRERRGIYSLFLPSFSPPSLPVLRVLSLLRLNVKRHMGTQRLRDCLARDRHHLLGQLLVYLPLWSLTAAGRNRTEKKIGLSVEGRLKKMEACQWRPYIIRRESLSVCINVSKISPVPPGVPIAARAPCTTRD